MMAKTCEQEQFNCLPLFRGIKTVILAIYGAAGHVLPCMCKYSTCVSERSERHAMIIAAPLSNVQ